MKLNTPTQYNPTGVQANFQILQDGKVIGNGRLNNELILDLATEPNLCWTLDFMQDALYCGRWFRTLNVIDEANRESKCLLPQPIR
ncbi:hypothetical protein D3C86_1682630 [compost metagenome]